MVLRRSIGRRSIESCLIRRHWIDNDYSDIGSATLDGLGNDKFFLLFQKQASLDNRPNGTKLFESRNRAKVGPGRMYFDRKPNDRAT